MRSRLLTAAALAPPGVVLPAMAWYAWPRSPLDVTPGSVIVTHYPGLLQKGVALLLLYWLGALLALLFLTARRPNAGPRTTWCLVTAGASAILVSGLLWYSARGAAPGMFLWGASMWLSAGALWLYGNIVGWRRDALHITMALWCASPFILFLAPLVYLWGCHPWWDASQVQLPDGRIYHVQRWGELDLLTQEMSRDSLFLRTRIIGANDNEYLSVLVVRPGGARRYDLDANDGGKGSGRLLYSERQQMLVFAYPFHLHPGAWVGCAASLAYDLRARRFYGSLGLEEMSPFVLISPTDALNEADAVALVHLYGRDTSGGQWIDISTRATLLRERTNLDYSYSAARRRDGCCTGHVCPRADNS